MSPSSPPSTSNDNADNIGVTTEYQFGLFCVAFASMLSGLSAALTQRALSGTQSRHTMLYSAEMAVYGIVFLLGNLMVNSDIQAGSTLWAHWDLSTMFPVITNVRHVIMCYGISICLLLWHLAVWWTCPRYPLCSNLNLKQLFTIQHYFGILQALGGMVVGLVTKYAGGVVKGFALIAGMYMSFLYSISIFRCCNLCCVGMSYTGIHTHRGFSCISIIRTPYL